MIYGEKQAQSLTKTLLVNELPENIQKLAKNANISHETEIQMKNSILQAHLFDTHQEKLVIRKNPEKPMWNFPRDYGITDQRKKYFFKFSFFSGLKFKPPFNEFQLKSITFIDLFQSIYYRKIAAIL